MSTARAREILGKVAYAGACFLAAVVLVFSGYAYKIVSAISRTGQGIGIKGAPSAGAMNILVMGLESRTDYNGNTLPRGLLRAMHSGRKGGQDTNTLILIHIFRGGRKVVGFSIPRDDLVTYPHATYLGITEGKIDQAYDWAYNQSLGQTVSSGDSSNQRYLLANQAGQLFEIQTVQELTGVHIDHFVEVNLAGFYYLAQAFHGIEICIRPAPAQGGFAAGANLTDYDPLTRTNNSGFNAYKDGYNKKKGGAQYLHLWSAQSLSYVRSRDTLPGVDIGRTKRQQAVIEYVTWKLKHESVFSDPSLLDSLLSTASKYLITDSTFNLPSFVAGMSALSASHLHFKTLPATPSNGAVVLPGFPQGEDVNYVNVPEIRQIVRSAFYPPSGAKSVHKGKKGGAGGSTPATPPSKITVDVYNGGNTSGLASRVSQALVALGYKPGAIENASSQSQTVTAGTQVFFGAGASANAANIATYFGTTAKPLKSLPANHVEVLLGSAVTTVPAGLASHGTSTASPQSAGARLITSKTSTISDPAHSPSPKAGAANGTVGGGIKVAPKYGISSCPY
jgi:anionic cell wall polymer biosynthesis LytR-Cps2A-Psr (LCP) family protein